MFVLKIQIVVYHDFERWLSLNCSIKMLFPIFFVYFTCKSEDYKDYDRKKSFFTGKLVSGRNFLGCETLKGEGYFGPLIQTRNKRKAVKQSSPQKLSRYSKTSLCKRRDRGPIVVRYRTSNSVLVSVLVMSKTFISDQNFKFIRLKKPHPLFCHLENF